MSKLTKSERVGLWVVEHVATMQCFYLFCLIGIGALIGGLMNWQIGLLCGIFSSQFIQLVMLPLIMIGQNVQSKHSERIEEQIFRMEKIHGQLLEDIIQLIN